VTGLRAGVQCGLDPERSCEKRAHFGVFRALIRGCSHFRCRGSETRCSTGKPGLCLNEVGETRVLAKDPERRIT